MRKNKRYNEYDTLLEGGQEDKPKSEAPKEDDDDPYAEPVLEECCCCDCVCANEFTQGYTFCICFPIKCGVTTIGVLTLILTTVLFLWYFF